MTEEVPDGPIGESMKKDLLLKNTGSSLGEAISYSFAIIAWDTEPIKKN